MFQTFSGRPGALASSFASWRQSFVLMTLGSSLLMGMASGQVPSTQVLVEVVRGDLRVTFQADSTQSVLITPGNHPGQFRFEGGSIPNSMTFFNNQPSLMVSGVVGDVILDLKSGVKTVVMETTGTNQNVAIPANLVVSSASNCSTFLFFKDLDVRGTTNINLRGNTDILDLYNGIFRGSISIKTGKGADSVGIQGRAVRPNSRPTLILDDVKMDTGSGADSLFLGDIESIGEFDLRLGSENDEVRLFRNEMMTVNVDGMRGLDHAQVDDESSFLDLNLKSIELQSSFN